MWTQFQPRRTTAQQAPSVSSAAGTAPAGTTVRLATEQGGGSKNPVGSEAASSCLEDPSALAGVSSSVKTGSSIDAYDDHISSNKEEEEDDFSAKLLFAEAIWGLRPLSDLSTIRWARKGCSQAATGEQAAKVFDATEATSAVDLGDAWRMLPSPIAGFIDSVRALWPLKQQVWQHRLAHDSDWPFLSRVLSDGVGIVHPSAVPPVTDPKNYSSFLLATEGCSSVLRSESERGLIVAAPEWMSQYWIHPLGAVPKKNGTVRIIHDCSAPQGLSLNDRQSYLYMPWASVDDILRAVTPGCYMAGIDIQEYYRNFPVHPACWPLQCFRDAAGTVLVDSRLQFGHRMAPEVASRFSAALARHLAGSFAVDVVAVMDDFTLIKADQEACLLAWQGSCDALQQLGFKLSQGVGKTEPPATSKVSLGLQIDSAAMTVGVCNVKLAKLADLCSALLQQKYVTRKQLERVLGFLLWVSRVVYAGRTFCHNLRATMLKLRRPHHRARVSGWIKSELSWWLHVAPTLNGAHKILPAVPVKWAEFQTDASLTGASGMPCVGVWLQGAYNSLDSAALLTLFADVPDCSAHISVWEMYAVVVCCRLYADYMANQYWQVRTDNAQVVSWFMKGDAPPIQVSVWLKELASMSVEHRFRLGTKHIPGAANKMADALSRCDHVSVASYLQKWKLSRSEDWCSDQ